MKELKRYKLVNVRTQFCGGHHQMLAQKNYYTEGRIIFLSNFQITINEDLVTYTLTSHRVNDNDQHNVTSIRHYISVCIWEWVAVWFVLLLEANNVFVHSIYSSFKCVFWNRNFR